MSEKSRAGADYSAAPEKREGAEQGSVPSFSMPLEAGAGSSPALLDSRLSRIATAIFSDLMARILLHLPYLAPAVTALMPAPTDSSGTEVRAASGASSSSGNQRPKMAPLLRLGTDGRHLYYDPRHLITIWRSDPASAARDLLHIVMHCLFRHHLTDYSLTVPGSRERWNLACDIAVEALISQLGDSAFSSPRERQQASMRALLTGEIGPPLTAERIYKYLREKGLEGEELTKERLHFMADQHRLWYDIGTADALIIDEEHSFWEAHARMTEQMALEEEHDDAIAAALRQQAKKEISYAQLLMRLLNRQEILRASDEFDYVYYTYGLSLYGSIPLMEMLEYRDDARIRSLAIAIDTSGSVRGPVVQAFLRETCALLFREDLVAERMHILILLCDDRIQEEIVLHNRQELTAFADTVTIRGYGQTDFRPVFARVSDLLARGELPDFQGLLYYTDGLGIFPGEAPPFETVFILSRETFVPEWAIKYVLHEDELKGAGL